MLRPVSLAQHWQRIEAGLPEDWSDARLALAVADAATLPRAAALLGPLQPGRAGNELRFDATRRGAGASPGSIGRALARLDDEGIGGAIRVLSTEEVEAAPRPAEPQSVAGDWDRELGQLSPDWSDIWGEVELTSSDHLDPAALAMSPLNPTRSEGATAFRFRCARLAGYGTSPGMVRRCLARLDEQGIPASVRILRSLSDTKPVGTQGPVWYVAGKVV